MDDDALANEKRTVYLQVIPTTIVPLKGKGFKVESAPEEKVGDKPAAVLKVTGPDGKDFTLFFDKESGLPVKLVATVAGFRARSSPRRRPTPTTRTSAGSRRPRRSRASATARSSSTQEITEFKVLDKVDAGHLRPSRSDGRDGPEGGPGPGPSRAATHPRRPGWEAERAARELPS